MSRNEADSALNFCELYSKILKDFVVSLTLYKTRKLPAADSAAAAAAAVAAAAAAAAACTTATAAASATTAATYDAAAVFESLITKVY